MHRRLLIALLIILSLILSGCGPAPDRSGDAAPVQADLPAATATPAPTPTEAALAEPTVAATQETSEAAEPQASPEAVSEPEDPAEAPVAESAILTFNISGGMVGFCDSLAIHEQGEYRWQSCQGEELTGLLEDTDQESLQSWYDNLAGFELTFADQPEGVDQLTAELVFKGQGSEEADEPQQQIIFDWVNGLLIRLRPQPVAAPATPELPQIGPEGLCPEIKRPAMLVADYEKPSNLILIDPETQAQCDILLPQPPFGRILTAVGHIYYPVFDPESETITIWQLSPQGEQTPLTFTSVSMTDFGPFNFVVADDGSRIAWSRAVVNFEANPPIYRNDLWVANIDGSGQVTLLEQQEEASRVVEPIRFSQDNSTLFYALQPDGLGGMIFSFSGRYDNVYSVPAAGGQPELVFACQTEQNPICVGDIAPDGGTVVYTQLEEGVLQVISRDSSLINTLSPPVTDYVGRGVFGPTGNLAFISAVLAEPEGEEGLPRPAPGYISLIEPPYTGQSRNLLTGNDVAVLWEWVDENRLAYGAMDESGNIGTSIVTLEGQTTELSANFALAVLR